MPTIARGIAVLMVVVGFGLVGFGAYFGIWNVQQINAELAATTGTIQSTRVVAVEAQSGVRPDSKFVPRVTYTYTVDGHSYRGTRIYHTLEREATGRRFESQAGAKAVLEQYDPGDTVTVYYFPNNPSRAMLVKPDLQLVALGILGFLSLFPFGIAAGIEFLLRTNVTD